MPITVKLTHDVSPAADWTPAPDYTVLDDDAVIGRVHQIEEGPSRGMWMWTLTASRPNESEPLPCGRAAEMGEAGQRLLAAYETLLGRLGRELPTR